MRSQHDGKAAGLITGDQHRLPHLSRTEVPRIKGIEDGRGSLIRRHGDARSRSSGGRSHGRAEARGWPPPPPAAARRPHHLTRTRHLPSGVPTGLDAEPQRGEPGSEDKDRDDHRRPMRRAVFRATNGARGRPCITGSSTVGRHRNVTGRPARAGTVTRHAAPTRAAAPRHPPPWAARGPRSTAARWSSTPARRSPSSRSLAADDRAFARDELAALLWPDSDDTSGRGALRRTLSTLRAAIGEGADGLRIDRERVALVDPGTRVDVRDLERLARSDARRRPRRGGRARSRTVPRRVHVA